MSNQKDSVLNVARKYIGTKENPPGSNNVVFNTKFYGTEVQGENYSWCAIAVGYWFWEAKLLELTDFYNQGDDYAYNSKNIAFVPNWESMAKSCQRWITCDYCSGDCVLFSWSGGSTASHIGIIESVSEDGNTLTTIEGNSSDCVSRNTRPVNQTVLGAFRPNYKEDDTMQEVKTPDLPDEWAKEAMDWAVKCGLLVGDETGDLMSHKDLTRQELALVLYRFYQQCVKPQ